MIHLYAPIFFSFVFLAEAIRTNNIFYIAGIAVFVLIDSVFCAKLRVNAPPKNIKLDKVKKEILEEILKTNDLAIIKDEITKLQSRVGFLSGRGTYE